MSLENLIGLKGGRDETFFEILAVQGRGKTKYWPAIKDGKELSLTETYGKMSLEEYFSYKVERERETVRFLVAGNPISAESALREKGYCALSTTPTTVDIYVKEENQ